MTKSIKVDDLDVHYFDDEDDVIVSWLKSGIFYAKNNFQLLTKFLTRKTTILDCGCHIGTFAIPAAKHGYHVIAIDGGKLNIECLSNTIGSNKQLDILPINSILSDSIHRCSFSHPYGPYGGIVDGEDMETSTIDIVCKGVDICGIKLDLEGGEFEALKGASKTISKYKPTILVEINAHCLGFKNNSPHDILYKLDEFGYSVFILMVKSKNDTGQKQILYKVDPKKQFPFCVIDVVAVHRDNVNKIPYLCLQEPKEFSDQEITTIANSNYRMSNPDCKKYFENAFNIRKINGN